MGGLGGEYESSYAYGVNDSGEVVGSSIVSGQPHAFLYNGTSMLDINNLIDPAMGYTVTHAHAINNSGDVIGTGGTLQGGYDDVLLLIPVPEPSTVLALAGGMIGMVGFALRRKRL